MVVNDPCRCSSCLKFLPRRRRHRRRGRRCCRRRRRCSANGPWTAPGLRSPKKPRLSCAYAPRMDCMRHANFANGTPFLFFDNNHDVGQRLHLLTVDDVQVGANETCAQHGHPESRRQQGSQASPGPHHSRESRCTVVRASFAIGIILKLMSCVSA